VKRVIWDIETSPNIGFFWRPGYNLSITHDNIISERAIICICWKEEGAKGVKSLEWDNSKAESNEQDLDMLTEFAKVVDDADEMVAHNGDRFDMAWVKGRCILHGIDLFPFAKTVDTLAWSKKLGLNSNKLDYLGQYLLGEGKIHTDYSMWKDIVLDNCPKAMAKMVKYSKKDVDLLERVYQELSKYAKPKTHVGVLTGGERWHCAHCGSKNVVRNRRTVTAAGTVHHAMKCKDCGRYYTINDKVYEDYKKARLPQTT